MTPEQADKAQQWTGMDGATAFLNIERHADDWHEINALMEAWRRAAVAAAVRRCAELAQPFVTFTHGKTVVDAIRAEFPEAFK